MKIRGIEFENIVSKSAKSDYYIKVFGDNGNKVAKRVNGDWYTVKIRNTQLIFAIRKDSNYYNEYVATEIGSGMVAVTDKKLIGLLSKLNDKEYMEKIYDNVICTEKFAKLTIEFSNMVNELQAKENKEMESKDIKVETKENKVMETKAKETKAKKSAKAKESKVETKVKENKAMESKAKNKVETVDTNTFKATKVKRISKALAKKSSGNEHLDKLMAEFTDCEFKLDRTWLWISGNTREHKEEFKKMGAFFTGKKMMWYVPNWLDSHPNA